MLKRLHVVTYFLLSIFYISNSHAFWVVNFGTADTLTPKKVGFAAGMGGQAVFAGSPQKTNAFFMIPHAGLRIGLTEKMDMGVRLAPVPLPFSSVGPGFGMNLDLKINLNDENATNRFAFILGAGGAHVIVQDVNRHAWSPNAAFLFSRKINKDFDMTIMARYVYLGIASAPGNNAQNNVQITGASYGLKYQLNERVSLLPEVGAYHYEGRLLGERTSGPGFQYGIMLATTI